MSSHKETSSKNTPPCTQWDSLVRRSVEAWVAPDHHDHAHEKGFLQRHNDLDDFLTRSKSPLMFWFFQRREAFLSQKVMTKWSRDRLDDYVLFPASNGFVTRDECFFVSHFWHAHNDPDPGGKYLQLMQRELKSQSWSYIWVDWTCIPQCPRSDSEEDYFLRALQTMPAIIRNCGFMWYYPPWEPRMWILYEVAENTLTCVGHPGGTEDIKEFVDHVKEMCEIGVRATLSKHGYRCTFDRDKEFLTAWLELLVLLKRLLVEVSDIRTILDHLTWYRTLQELLINTCNGCLALHHFKGTLSLGGKRYRFTPFPQWVSFPLS